MPRKPFTANQLKPLNSLSDWEQQEVHNILHGEGNRKGGRQDSAGLLAKSVAKRIAWAKKKVQKLAVMMNADDFGRVACVTCGQVYQYNSTSIHGGHFVHSGSGRYATALMLANIYPQDADCNTTNSGAKDRFRKFIGDELADWLEIESRKPSQWTAEAIAIYLVTVIEPELRKHTNRLKTSHPPTM